jgi:hypothetical protein
MYGNAGQSVWPQANTSIRYSNIGIEDPDRVNYLEENSTGGNSTKPLVFKGYIFANTTGNIPEEFTDEVLRIKNVRDILVPLTLEFRPRDVTPRPSQKLLNHMVNHGTSSRILDYCMQKGYNSKQDVRKELSAPEKESTDVFPKSAARSIGYHLKEIDTKSKFNPTAITVNKKPIVATIEKYNHFHDWLTTIETITETADTTGMMKEYIQRALVTPMLTPGTTNYLSVKPCYDWGDLDIYKPEFYQNLKLEQDELDLFIRALKDPDSKHRNGGFVEEDEPRRQGTRSVADHLEWEANNPKQVAFKQAVTKNACLGYFVLSNPQKDAVDLVEQQIDLMLKLVLKKTCDMDTLNFNCSPGNNFKNTRGIDILRSMNHKYASVNDLELDQLITRLKIWKFTEIECDEETTNKSIIGWNKTYTILKEFNKVTDKQTIDDLQHSLRDSYKLKNKMLTSVPTLFGSANAVIKSRMTVEDFFTEMMAEYKQHQSTTKRPNAQAKRKFNTTNNVTVEECSNCGKNHAGGRALCWAKGGGKHGQRKFKGNPKGKVKGTNQNVKCKKCGRTNHDGIIKRCYAKHCTICDAMYNDDGHVKCAVEKEKIRTAKAADTANKCTEVAKSPSNAVKDAVYREIDSEMMTEEDYNEFKAYKDDEDP